ncbi:MAG: hypothetical protein AB1384_10965 [Actinomycetota bacterium]
MSCYFRHTAEVLAEAGIDLEEVKADKARKKALDEKLHGLVGVEYKDFCQAPASRLMVHRWRKGEAWTPMSSASR